MSHTLSPSFFKHHKRTPKMFNPTGEKVRSRQSQVMDNDGKRRQASVCDSVTDQDKTVISKIMQRFRPIAPKQTVGESSDDTKRCRFLGRNRRSKRKYVRARDKKNSSGSNNKDKIIGKKTGCDGGNIKTELDKEVDGDDRSDRVTLQLLPEKDRDLGDNGDQAGDISDLSDMDPKKCLYGPIVGLSPSLDQTVMESWVTVECVSETCDLGGYYILEQLGRMDQGEERVMRMLEVDTSPWLVSDGSTRVCWINRAYRRIMGGPEVEVIRVWLLVAMDLMEEIACMVELYGAVTCRVRIRYEPSTWRNMAVPCDVWRIRSGGFAWRLDVESALRLGR